MLMLVHREAVACLSQLAEACIILRLAVLGRRVHLAEVSFVLTGHDFRTFPDGHLLDVRVRLQAVTNTLLRDHNGLVSDSCEANRVRGLHVHGTVIVILLVVRRAHRLELSVGDLIRD